MLAGRHALVPASKRCRKTCRSVSGEPNLAVQLGGAGVASSEPTISVMSTTGHALYRLVSMAWELMGGWEDGRMG